MNSCSCANFLHISSPTHILRASYCVRLQHADTSSKKCVSSLNRLLGLTRCADGHDPSVIFVLIYFLVLVLVFQLFLNFSFVIVFIIFFVLVLVLVLPIIFSFSFVLVLEYFFVLVLPTTKEYQTCWRRRVDDLPKYRSPLVTDSTPYGCSTHKCRTVC